MTNTNTDSRALLNELGALLRLTRMEAQIARVRVSQAQRDEIRRELEDNANEADGRSARIEDALVGIGGTPDILGDAIGRVAAFTKVTGEQAQPFSEGLLGDLALEHQLRDRVVFTRVLAEAQNQTAVVNLMRDLEKAHTETIEWIRVRLAELAQGGPVGLAPTPAQSAVGTVTRFATLPPRQTAALVNRAVQVLRKGRNNVQEAVGTVVDKVEKSGKAAADIVTAGRDASLARAEQVAPSATVRDTAQAARKRLGAVDADELPIKEYDSLSSDAAVEAINGLEDAEAVRVVLRYEEANKARRGVTAAADKRLTGLAKESVAN